MKRTAVVVALAVAGPLAVASPAMAQPISEPASCQGYLASYANPNYAFILEELARPMAEELGITVGQLLAMSAVQHLGGLEPCIP